MENKLKFFTKVSNSMFNIKSYPMLAKQTFSSVLGYILILSIIVGGILGVSQFALFNLMEKSSKEILQDEKYKFTLDNGVLEFKNSPYEIEESDIIVIIDTNKSLNDRDSLRSSTVHKDISTVFLKDGIIARSYGQESYMKYSDLFFLQEPIDNSIVINFIDKISPFKYVVLLISIMLIYLRLLIFSIIISIIGIIANKIQGNTMKYIDILKISLFSLTLPTLIQLILPLGFITIVISSLYVVFALSYFRDKEVI